MSDYTLYLGDCLEYMRTMEPGSVDAVITDMPYGTTACSWDEIIPFTPMWEGVKRILKPRGAFVTTASQPFTSKLIMSNLDWFKYEWIWNKINPTGFQLSKYQPMKKHENICVFSRNGHIYNPIPEKANRYNVRPRNKGTKQKNIDVASIASGVSKSSPDYDINSRLPSSIIELSKFSDECNPTEDRLHPTQKPVALYSYLVQTYTNPDALVFDMCMGSGTTGVACMQLGRRFIGCEIDPNYYAIAERRIKQAAAQMLLPLEVRV